MNRIKELRTEKNISMREASRLLNIPYTTYVNYEKGYREPNSEQLIALAQFYDTSIDYLIGRSDFRVHDNQLKLKPPTITEDYVTFPVIGEIAAGYDCPAFEDWGGDTVDVPTSYLHGRPQSDFFVLSVKGDSMYPEYQEGDRVLILKQSTLNYSGQVGAILYDGEMATLKRVEYKKGEDWLRMVPINPSFKPQKIEGVDLEECRILGIPRLLIREVEQ